MIFFSVGFLFAGRYMGQMGGGQDNSPDASADAVSVAEFDFPLCILHPAKFPVKQLARCQLQQISLQNEWRVNDALAGLFTKKH